MEIGRLCSSSMSIEQSTQTEPSNFFQQCQASDKWMPYYANVTPEGFRSLFDAMGPKLRNSDDEDDSSSLPPEEQLFMALVKLTLYLDDEDLAFRFNIPETDVARYLNRWVIENSFVSLQIKIDFCLYRIRPSGPTGAFLTRSPLDPANAGNVTRRRSISIKFENVDGAILSLCNFFL